MTQSRATHIAKRIAYDLEWMQYCVIFRVFFKHVRDMIFEVQNMRNACYHFYVPLFNHTSASET